MRSTEKRSSKLFGMPELAIYSCLLRSVSGSSQRTEWRRCIACREEARTWIGAASYPYQDATRLTVAADSFMQSGSGRHRPFTVVDLALGLSASSSRRRLEPGSQRSGWATIGGDSSANAFARDHSCNVPNFLVVEDDDIDVVFHTVMHRLCIHDLQVLSEHITE